MIAVECDESGNVTIAGDATVHEAETLRDGLLDAVRASYPAYTLSLAKLTAVDSCGAQLLVSFRRSVPKVRVHSCPQPLRRTLEQIGLARHVL